MQSISNSIEAVYLTVRRTGMQLEADTVRVFVSDLARAISFYRDALGIPLHVDKK